MLFLFAAVMKAWASYALPVSCLLLLSGGSGWYFYSKINVLLDVARLTKAENVQGRKANIAQNQQAIDQDLNKLKFLFGNPKSNSSKVVEIAKRPELAVALYGVFAGSGERKSAAIVSFNGGRQRIYYEGDALAEELKLVSVQDKEILIKDASGLRSVRLEQKLDGDSASVAPPGHLVKESSRKELSKKDAAPDPGSSVKGGWGSDKDVSGRLSRLKSLAHEERK